MPAVKVATCNYCGTRAALVLKGRVQHELACGTCGAPLHEIKQMPSRTSKSTRSASRPADSHDRAMSKKSYRKKEKKRQSWTSRAFEELFDIVEDIFD